MPPADKKLLFDYDYACSSEVIGSAALKIDESDVRRYIWREYTSYGREPNIVNKPNRPKSPKDKAISREQQRVEDILASWSGVIKIRRVST